MRTVPVLFVLVLASRLCSAQSFDTVGRSEVLPDPERDWVFVDFRLIDVSEDKFLGLVGVSGTGFGGAAINFSPDDASMFVTESFYSRGTRGDRTDIVTILDTATLGVTGEVVIPPKLALMGVAEGSAALSGNDRFLAVFNLTPATSLSIVDIEQQTFVGEISTPGCSLAFPAGELRYVMICANGGLLTVTLDENGREASKVRTEGFFDPESDPIREGGVRYGDEWLFVTFDGMLLPLDVSGAEPRFGEPWSLLGERDRAENWRVAGRQNLSVHRPTGRLYSLVRQSETPLDDPADMDGTEVWVYDLQSRERLQRFEAVPEREDGESGGGGIGASSGDGASAIIVTQGDDPLLVTLGGGISVRNALTGEYLHETLSSVSEGRRLSLRLD